MEKILLIVVARFLACSDGTALEPTKITSQTVLNDGSRMVVLPPNSSMITVYCNPAPVNNDGCFVDNHCPGDRVCDGAKCVNPCIGRSRENTICHVIDHKISYYCLPGFIGDPNVGCKVECTENQHCPEDRTCVDKKCNDPCGSVRGKNTYCLAENHKATFYCLPGFFGDPKAGCNVECFEDNQCAADKICVRNTCVDPCESYSYKNTWCHVTNHQPVLNCLPGFSGDPFVECLQIGECKENDQCADDRACDNSTCVNPCSGQSKENTFCHVSNHQVSFHCVPGFVGDPNVGCKVECTKEDDCPNDKSCLANKCVDTCVGRSTNSTSCHVVNHKATLNCLPGLVGDPLVGCQDIKTRAKDYTDTDGRYFVYTQAMNWYQGLELCARNGLRGASFEYQSDYEQILTLVNKLPQEYSYWLGASDLGTTNKYTWQDTGFPMVNNKWHDIEPNHATGRNNEVEHCVSLTKYESFLLNDLTCSSDLCILCEKW